MKITRTEHFDIQRKIVANMTTESWEQIPHVAYVYEADVTDLMTEFKKLRSTGKTKITLNTVLMKAIIEGLKEAGFPEGNIHRVDSLDDSTRLLHSLVRPTDTVLYENDLPDHYQEA